MKSKRFTSLLAFLLAFAILVSFTSCGQNNPSNNSSSTGVESSQSSKDGKGGKLGGKNESSAVSQKQEDSSSASSDSSVSSEPVYEETQELAALRASMKEIACGVGVAYLGWYESDYNGLNGFLTESGLIEKFPFLADLPKESFVDCEGAELYLVVPANKNTSVSVNDWIIDESNDFYGEAGSTEYYRANSGKPFLLKCNVSDIMPNTVICVNVGNGKLLEYTPALSLMDGSLSTPDVYEEGYGVMDLYPVDTEIEYMGAELYDIRSYLMESGDICAESFLGYYGSNWEYMQDYLNDAGYLMMFPFLADLTEAQFVCGEGEELYLIVPRDPNASVAINQLDENGEVEAVLYRSDYGDPILVQGNIGTYMGEDERFNLEMSIVNSDGTTLLCYPGVDFGYNGVFNDLPILDMTGGFWEDWEDPNPVSSWESLNKEDCVGAWEGYVIPDDGRASYSVYLELHEDGTVYYLCRNYGESSDEPAFYYDGTWKYERFNDEYMPASAYVFDLTLSQVDGDAGSIKPLQKIHSIQFISADPYSNLSIQFVDGDDLYPNGYEYPVYLYNASPVG